MTKKKLREISIETHANFIHHDVHCSTCSQASAKGAGWKSAMCPEGMTLFNISYHAQMELEAAMG